MDKIKIDVINDNSHIDKVKSLWRENSQTLGFFPDGAFEDHAAKRTILLAIDEKNNCIGYLLYRISKDKTSITHLCIDAACRGKGIAKLLVNKLVDITKETRGISLKCRKDFPANRLWPQLFFHAESYKQGRGKDKKELVHWWRPQQREENLFSHTAKKVQETKISAVIDSNVFFDLQNEASEITIPSKSLQADWLADTLELFITDEILNELDRNEDQNKVKQNRKFAGKFHCLPCEIKQCENIITSIRPLFPDNMKKQDWSDMRQVARAIAANASYFITRDNDLLNIADIIEANHGLMILHPTQLIIRLDELRRDSEYEPAKFIQTELTSRRIGFNDEQELAKYFCKDSLGEKQSQFYTTLRTYLSSPDKYESIVIYDKDKTPVALLVYDIYINKNTEQIIRMLRICHGTQANTFARQMVRQCILLTLQSKAQLTRVTDNYLENNIEAELYSFGFFDTTEGWVKISLPVIDSANNIADKILALGDFISVETEGLEEWVKMELRDSKSVSIPEYALEQEHILWPAKISDSSIHSYIVPIKPKWAEELFDEKLAGDSLWGRLESLAINTEAVYYRSARGKIIAPARILWYVSGDHNISGTKCIRACSKLDYVDIGLPKDLFRKYKRLGIYEWKHVYKTSHNNINKNIMALKFSNTELFSKPVSWKNLQDILQNHGISTQIQQPLMITNDIFLKIYRKAADLI